MADRDNCSLRPEASLVARREGHAQRELCTLLQLPLERRHHDDRRCLADAADVVGQLELEVRHELREERLQLVYPKYGAMSQLQSSSRARDRDAAPRQKGGLPPQRY